MASRATLIDEDDEDEEFEAAFSVSLTKAEAFNFDAGHVTLPYEPIGY